MYIQPHRLWFQEGYIFKDIKTLGSEGVLIRFLMIMMFGIGSSICNRRERKKGRKKTHTHTHTDTRDTSNLEADFVHKFAYVCIN